MYPQEDEKPWLAGPLYAAVERALWALAPIVLVVLLLSIPTLQAAHRQSEADLAKDVASENHRYCEKWGMAASSAAEARCIRDLVGIRARAEQHVRDELAGEF